MKIACAKLTYGRRMANAEPVWVEKYILW